MRKLIVIAILFAYMAPAMAQTEPDTVVTDYSRQPKDKLKKEDFFISDIFTDVWQNTPTQPDPLETKTLNRGYNAAFMLDNPLGNSNFSLAIGLGISVHNMYSNAMPFEKMDTAGNMLGETEFLKIPDNISYSKNKLTLFYTDIPVEIRFRTKNVSDNFKVAVGFKAGYLMQSHTKYQGDRLDNIKGDIKFKQYDIPNIEKLRYGVTARIGYGRFNVTGYYSLTTLFAKDKGPEMFPISVGVAVTPF